MLDDHILKAQTMHSSAYIKPFEEEMKEWEDKLISMQDILDAWLRCQESWLYLEPIFNSEDIMKQMPVEGRKFNKVNFSCHQCPSLCLTRPTLAAKGQNGQKSINIMQ